MHTSPLMATTFTTLRVLTLGLTLASGVKSATAGATNLVNAGHHPALASLRSLQVEPYMGRWYQVALYPNRFQKQCISDTSATYQLRGDGTLDVLNQCLDSAGQWDQATGVARPVGEVKNGWISPAQLQVSFLPGWLRWLPVGWGDYWVIKLAEDHRYAVISEPGREFLWVLSRTPRLSATDEIQIRAFLVAEGFDLARLQTHRHSAP